MHTVFALLCFVVVIHWLIFPYPSGLLHWHCGNLTIAPVPAKQPWWIWINTSFEFIMNDCIATTKQSTTKPWAYFLGYTVHAHQLTFLAGVINCLTKIHCFKWPVTCRLIDKADPRFVPSKWETTLLCNDVSHWLGENLESAMSVTCIQFIEILRQL